MNKSILLSCLVFSAVWVDASSASAVPVETTSTVVRYGDLNLASADGAKAMLQRIKRAARRVCDPEPAFNEFAEYSDWRQCMAKSVDQAVGRLNAPMVTAAYGARSPARVRLAAAEPR